MATRARFTDSVRSQPGLVGAFLIDAVGTGMFIPFSLLFFLATMSLPLARIGLGAVGRRPCADPGDRRGGSAVRPVRAPRRDRRGAAATGGGLRRVPIRARFLGARRRRRPCADRQLGWQPCMPDSFLPVRATSRPITWRVPRTAATHNALTVPPRARPRATPASFLLLLRSRCNTDYFGGRLSWC